MFLAFLRTAWGFLKLIPWQVWAALAAALAIMYFGHIRYKAGYARAEAVYQAHFRDLERQRDEANKAVQKALAERNEAAEKLKKAHEEALAEAEAKRLKDLADQKRRLTANVTTESTRSCPDVPRSYILFRVDAAAFANGVGGAETAGTAAGVEPEGSGVSLPALAETDLAQANAFREAVTWGEAWRDYADRTKQTCEQAFEVLTR